VTLKELTNEPRCFALAITTIDTITAIAITQNFFAVPTAVRTESSENTTLMIAMFRMAATNPEPLRFEGPCSVWGFSTAT